MTNLLCVSAYSHSGSKFIDHVLSVFLDQLLDLLSIQAFSEPGTPEYRKEQGTYGSCWKKLKVNVLGGGGGGGGGGQIN